MLIKWCQDLSHLFSTYVGALKVLPSGHEVDKFRLLELIFILCIRVIGNHFFCIAHLRPEMKSIATNYMPEVVSDL